MLPKKNTINFLKVAQEESLYVALIEQLNKDFKLSNINTFFSVDYSPFILYEKLNEVIYSLIATKYDDYLKLVYRIDLSEKELHKIIDNNLDLVAKKVTYLVLRREYQKVWLKKNY